MIFISVIKHVHLVSVNVFMDGKSFIRSTSVKVEMLMWLYPFFFDSGYWR